MFFWNKKKKDKEKKATVYDYSVPDCNGNEVPLSKYKGKVMIIVNSATACVFTAHYADLKDYYEKYTDRGLVIIDIPSNQFGAAKGTESEIYSYCKSNFKIPFAQMKKSEINGEKELPLYTFLKNERGFAGFGNSEHSDVLREILKQNDKDYARKTDIKWNFTKFIIDRKGNVVARFEPTYGMKDVEELINQLLDEDAE